MRKFHGLEKLRTNQTELANAYRLAKLLTIDLVGAQMIIYGDLWKKVNSDADSFHSVN